MGFTVAIIGGGVAGLSVAIAFAQRGADVSVYERAPLLSEIGAGLQITPNALRVLKQYGVDADLKRLSVKARAVVLRDYKQGARVTTLDLEKYAPDQGYYFVHRADLIQVLASKCTELGVRFHTGERISEVFPTEGRFVAKDGSNVLADIVVGAEGINSPLREKLNGVRDPIFRKQVAWRCLAPNSVDHPNEAQIHMGPGRHLVTYPIRNGDFVNIVAVQERDAWAAEGWMHEDDPQNLRDVFCDFGGEVQRLVSAVEQVKLWGLFGHPVAEKWWSGQSVLVGDAAHPTLPFLAQGANMAIEDSWVLANEVFKSRERGLKRYQDIRRPRVSRIIQASSQNAWKYHLKIGPVRSVAHTAMRAMGTIAPGRLVRSFDWLYGFDVTREIS